MLLLCDSCGNFNYIELGEKLVGNKEDKEKILKEFSLFLDKTMTKMLSNPDKPIDDIDKYKKCLEQEKILLIKNFQTYNLIPPNMYFEMTHPGENMLEYALLHAKN